MPIQIFPKVFIRLPLPSKFGNASPLSPEKVNSRNTRALAARCATAVSNHMNYSQYFLDTFKDTDLGFRDHVNDYTKLQEGPLCQVLRAP